MSDREVTLRYNAVIGGSLPGAKGSRRIRGVQPGRALARLDRAARLWDVSNPSAPREAAVLAVHTDTVIGVDFSSDGKTFASGGDNRTVRLWDVSDPNAVHQTASLTEDGDRVYGVTFAPDGHTLAGAVRDGIVRLWETGPERAAERSCAAVCPRITAAEWEQRLPGLDYRPPCP